MKSLGKMYEKLDKLADKVAGEWWSAQMKNEWASLYLYHSLAVPGGDWGSLIVAEDCPEGYYLSAPERLSPAMTKAQAAYKIRGIMNVLPIVGNTD
jgi:hypothetical protein